MSLSYCLSLLGCEVIYIIKKTLTVNHSKLYGNRTEFFRSLSFVTNELGLLSHITLKKAINYI